MFRQFLLVPSTLLSDGDRRTMMATTIDNKFRTSARGRRFTRGLRGFFLALAIVAKWRCRRSCITRRWRILSCSVWTPEAMAFLNEVESEVVRSSWSSNWASTSEPTSRTLSRLGMRNFFFAAARGGGR